jgi:hypothetical protein
MKTDQLQLLAQAASEAAHAPAVKFSAAASTVVVGTDWLTSGPGLVALVGVGLTAATFLVNLWSAYRRDKREQALAEAKLRALERAGADSDAAPLDAAFEHARHARATKEPS